MVRRQFIVAAGTAALTTAVSSAPAVSMQGSSPARRRAEDKERQAVIDAADDCMKTGEACLAMCNDMLRHGMTELAHCQARVVDMLTMCEAIGQMVVVNTAPAARLKALAGLCADTCRDCERACRPQAAKHPECKACMDDAGECAKACDVYKAA
jgi:Cys-rich four helix bundle protein (predicted Tat secretion target)